MIATLKQLIISTILFTAPSIMYSSVQAQTASPLRPPVPEAKGQEVTTSAQANFSSLTLEIDDPTWCYGWNDDTHTCGLYFGSKQACESLPSCQPTFQKLVSREHESPAAASHELEIDDPTWCYGWNDDIQACQLYLGSKQACESLPSCQPTFQKLISRDYEVRAQKAEEQATFAQLALKIDNPTWCYGWDEDTYTCQLYFGSKSSCETLTPCPQTLAYLAPAKDLTHVDRGPQAGDVCDGCSHCVYGCCWDSWPVPCNTLTAE